MKDLGLLFLRLSFGGGMFFAHGWPKLIGFSEKMQQFPDPIGLGSPFSLALAVFGEAVCAVAVMIGFKTKIFAVPTFITMAVAFFVIHSGDPWSAKELAFVYGCGFAAMIFLGSGRFSLDWWLKGEKSL